MSAQGCMGLCRQVTGGTVNGNMQEVIVCCLYRGGSSSWQRSRAKLAGESSTNSICTSCLCPFSWQSPTLHCAIHTGVSVEITELTGSSTANSFEDTTCLFYSADSLGEFLRLQGDRRGGAGRWGVGAKKLMAKTFHRQVEAI